MQTWLFSLKTKYAQRILTGEKEFEFRKVHVKATAGDKVLIYESWPVKQIVGEFTVGSVQHISAPQAVELEKHYPAELAEWFGEAKKATALEITNLIIYPKPKKLEHVGLTRGPQSYCKISDQAFS